jgi:hypothetical protein
MSGGVRNVYVHDCSFAGGDQGIRLKSMRGRGGVVEHVYFENITMTGVRQEAIVFNMFYGSTTVVPKSKTPPVFRDIHIKNVTCESAGTAIELCGLSEQPISRVTLERLRVNAVVGIHCRDIDDLTLRHISGVVEQEPLFSCSNVRGLDVISLDLQQGSCER